MVRAHSIVTDGTDSIVLGTNVLSGMHTRSFVVMTHDAVTVRTVSDEVNTVGFIALRARPCVCGTEDVIVGATP